MASNTPPGAMPVQVILTNYPPGGTSLAVPNPPPGAVPMSMNNPQTGAIAAVVDVVEDIELTIATLSSYSAYHMEMTIASPKTNGPQGHKTFKVSTLLVSLKSLKNDASRSVKAKIALLKALNKGKTKSTLTELKARNGEEFFDIEARLTSLKNNRQPKFTLFTKLPLEIQDEIWKIYVEQNPRMLTLPLNNELRGRWQGNPPLVLRQINQRLRGQPLATYGYATFSLRAQVKFNLRGVLPRMSDPGFVIHPEVDMLYIPGYNMSYFAGGFPSLLGPANTINRIRTLAVDLSIRPDTPFAHMFGHGLHEWISLELVMLVITHNNPMSGGPFRFEKLEIDDFLPSNQRVSFEITLKLLQVLFSRDHGNITPRIVCVEKVFM